MRRLALVSFVLLSGCSTAPVADLLDAVAPSRVGPAPDGPRLPPPGRLPAPDLTPRIPPPTGLAEPVPPPELPAPQPSGH